jgi:hypothetical protein
MSRPKLVDIRLLSDTLSGFFSSCETFASSPEVVVVVVVVVLSLAALLFFCAISRLDTALFEPELFDMFMVVVSRCPTDDDSTELAVMFAWASLNRPICHFVVDVVLLAAEARLAAAASLFSLVSDFVDTVSTSDEVTEAKSSSKFSSSALLAVGARKFDRDELSHEMKC